MAHRRSIDAVRNKRIAAKFSTSLSWKTRPCQHRLQVCTPWTPKNSLGLFGAAAVQQSWAEGFDQRTRSEHAVLPHLSGGRRCNPSRDTYLAISQNAGNFLAAASPHSVKKTRSGFALQHSCLPSMAFASKVFDPAWS